MIHFTYTHTTHTPLYPLLSHVGRRKKKPPSTKDPEAARKEREDLKNIYET